MKRLVSFVLIFLIVLPIYAVFTSMASATARPVSSDEGFLPYVTTQRIVLAELFTATWCGFCPYATQAINKLAGKYGSSSLVVLQYHPNDGFDPFGNAETDARMFSYYNITGYPTMIFDGTINTVGGWTGAYDSYNATIQSELQKSSDVSISLAGSLTDFTANVTASSSIQSIPAEVRFVVYEDDIPYNASNGETVFRFTVRAILNEQAITLIPGQTVSIQRVFQPQAGWNMSNLGLVAFVQRDDTREVLQAATFLKPTAFSFISPATVRTVQPNETASFSAILTNTGTLGDSYNLTLTSSLPAGWAAEFCNGSWCCLHSTIVAIPAGGSQNITTNVFTSNSSGSGNVTLEVTSQRDPTQTCSIVFDAIAGQVYVGSPGAFYFTDAWENPGSIYKLQNGVESTYYAGSSGRIDGLAFSPNRTLYFVDANDFNVFKVVDGAESVVYLHNTFVREVRFDSAGHLYFSDATGAGGDGHIYRLDNGVASLYYTVLLSSVGGSWAGTFSFDKDDTLYLSNGNEIPASIYKVVGGVPTIVLHVTDGAIMGMSFDSNGSILYADHGESIYKVDPSTGQRQLFYSNSLHHWLSDVARAPGILGDLNGDNKVSLADLVLLALAYGSKRGDLNWNPNADIDGNGRVGLTDLVTLAQHYGQHYP